MTLLAQADIPLNVLSNVVSRALESNGFAFLAGTLFGVFIIVKWLDIPDKLSAINEKVEDIRRRQKRIFEVLYQLTNNGKPSPISMEEIDTGNN